MSEDPVVSLFHLTETSAARAQAGGDDGKGSVYDYDADLAGSPSQRPVAIVGIGCRLPGADGPDELWKILRSGGDTVTRIPVEGTVDVTSPATPETPQRIIGRASGRLVDIDAFDADFFDISPREAARMDPQQRLLLETAWEAFEDAGQTRAALAGSRTGIFLSYLSTPYQELLQTAGICDLHSAIGAEGRGTAAGRLSYSFDLRGPSMVVDATCASSLLAVHLACQSINSGESSQALVGGVNIMLTPDLSIALSQAGVLSAQGLCRFGDAAADGYVRSEGIVAVIVKSLERAVADGDRIYAVIRGAGVTNDGRSGGTVTAPSTESQIEMLRSAYRNAGVRPSDIDYVEAHGTGTVMGDQVELTALARVLGAGRPNDRPCLLGSAKSNIGHTEGAAGLVGLVKVALSLHHRIIPATLHVAEPNPAVAWDDLPMALATTVRPWPDRGRPGLAGVSAFGLSGTNVHVVVAEATPGPAQVAEGSSGSGADGGASVDRAGADAGRAPVLLPLSASTPAALSDLAGAYLRRMEAGADGRPALADLCWNAGVHRTHHEYRAAVVGRTGAEIADRLRALRDGRHAAGVSVDYAGAGVRPKIAFVFPGQGSQWVGMGRGLLESSPVFRSAMAECDAAVRKETGWSLIERLLADEPLTGPEVTQPVLWAIEVALAAQWRELGVQPDVVIGHSMGETAAAYVAGALTLADAASIICRRSRALSRVRGQGAMVAVQLSTDEVERALAGFEEQVSVAVVNGDSSVVLAGDPGALQQVVRPLQERGIFCRPIKVDVASHSPQMDSLQDTLLQALDDVRPQAGQIPMRSTVTGARTDGSDLDASYWVDNLRRPVRFAEAVRAEAAESGTVFIEMGPHPMLTMPIQEILAADGRIGAAAASQRRDTPDRTALLETAGVLYTLGYEPDWTALRGGPGRFMSLPTYPWQRRRYWVTDAVAGPGVAVPLDPAEAAEAAVAGGTDHRVPPRRRAGRDGEARPVSRDHVPAVPRRRLATTEPVGSRPRDAVGSPDALHRYLLEQAGAVLGHAADDVDPRRPLTKIGFDSILVAELHNRVERDLGVKTPIAGLLRGLTLQQFGADLWQCLDEQFPAATPTARQETRGRQPVLPTAKGRKPDRPRPSARRGHPARSAGTAAVPMSATGTTARPARQDMDIPLT